MEYGGDGCKQKMLAAPPNQEERTRREGGKAWAGVTGRPLHPEKEDEEEEEEEKEEEEGGRGGWKKWRGVAGRPPQSRE